MLLQLCSWNSFNLGTKFYRCGLIWSITLRKSLTKAFVDSSKQGSLGSFSCTFPPNLTFPWLLDISGLDYICPTLSAVELLFQLYLFLQQLDIPECSISSDLPQILQAQQTFEFFFFFPLVALIDGSKFSTFCFFKLTIVQGSPIEINEFWVSLMCLLFNHIYHQHPELDNSICKYLPSAQHPTLTCNLSFEPHIP